MGGVWWGGGVRTVVRSVMWYAVTVLSCDGIPSPSSL
eukprot:COSAG06_NODE_41887_length_386_cov_31.181185_1_plen_36_part_10